MEDAVSVPDAGVAAGHPTILWIDDQPDEAGLLRFLSLEGFRVTPATTGTAALALAGARRYDAIVVDLHLPDLHGFTVIERLRGSGITCPVVAVTGHYLDPEAPRQADQVGATAFWYKPLWLDETAGLLRAAVARDSSARTAVTYSPPGSATEAGGHSQSADADSGETAIARLFGQLHYL